MKAMECLESEGALDRTILINAASLRLLNYRVHTYFIDLLVQKSYYVKKLEETKFSPRYELEPVNLQLAGFPIRAGTVSGNLCSFRHLIKPYNIYEEVEFKLDEQLKKIKIRPRDYVRKDCDEAIEKLIQGSNEKYWQDLYSYHKQLEAIDFGMHMKQLTLKPHKYLVFED